MAELGILLTVAGCPMRDKLRADITGAVAAVAGVTGVEIDFGVMTAEQRKELLSWQGGTTTPHRKLWIQQLDNGRNGGYFHQLIGRVEAVAPMPDGRIWRNA